MTSLKKTDARKSRTELIAELDELRGQLADQNAAGDAAELTPIGETARTQQVHANLRSMIVELDDRGRVVFVSLFASKLLGYEPDEIIRQQNFDSAHQDGRCVLLELYRTLKASPQSITVSCRLRHKNGHWVWLDTLASTRHDANGVPRFVALTWDAIRASEQDSSLRESAMHYRFLAESASDLIIELDAYARIQFLSPNCASLLARPVETLIGRTAEECALVENIHPDDIGAVVENFHQSFALVQETRLRLRCRFSGGKWRSLECVANPFEHLDGSLRLVVICRDITESERVRNELRESEERYRIVTEISRDNIIEYDESGRVIFANARADEVGGVQSGYLLGKHIDNAAEPIHPDDYERSMKMFNSLKNLGDTVELPPYRLRRLDGSWVWLRGVVTLYQAASGERRRLEVSQDISAKIDEEERRREFEEKMNEAQRLESLGVMAGGIAHDFNNLLTPILGEASLSILELPPNAAIRRRLDRIQKAAHRAASLTRQMLDYAGQETGQREILDLSRLVGEMGELLEGAVSGRAVLTYDLPSTVPSVEADSAQLSQVVINLITNATEAVKPGEGHIEISTGAVKTEELNAALLLGGQLPAALTCVYLEVSDNGCGMDNATRSKIFDPFFTTKFTGRGLGLSATLGMVRSHGGAIELETAEGSGTRFRVIFPSTTRAPAATLRPAPAMVENWTGSGTVLVVDDDADVRDLMRETLRRAKLTLLMASDGREGVELFRRHTAEIRAVVLDRTMPTVDGAEAVREIRRIRPEVRIILVSGYFEERAVWDFLDERLDFFLHKPFEPMELIEKVRAIFDD